MVVIRNFKDSIRQSQAYTGYLSRRRHIYYTELELEGRAPHILFHLVQLILRDDSELPSIEWANKRLEDV